MGDSPPPGTPQAKRLHRVAVEGEIWVMARSQEEAAAEARFALQDEDVSFYVYPFLPVKTSLVSSTALESLPYNADAGDERTVGEHLKVHETALSPAATTTATRIAK